MVIAPARSPWWWYHSHCGAPRTWVINLGDYEARKTHEHYHSYWKWPFIVDFPIQMVIFHSYVTVVNQRVYDSLSFHINIIIYYQYVVNLKQENPRSVAESALRSWEDRAARVPALAAGGECHAHMTFPNSWGPSMSSLNYLKGVFRGSLGLRGYVTSSRSTCFWVEASSSRGLWKPPLFGRYFWDTVTWAAIFTGTGSNLLGKVTCFITRSAGIYAWIYDIFFLDDQ